MKELSTMPFWKNINHTISDRGFFDQRDEQQAQFKLMQNAIDVDYVGAL